VRLPYVLAIYKKEMLDMVRDRRTMISMVIVPMFVFPIIMLIATRVVGSMEEKAEREAQTMTVGVRISNPAIRDALNKAGIRFADQDEVRSAVEKKVVVAGVEEAGEPGKPADIRVYSDNSNPTSAAAADRVRIALTELKDTTIREHLRTSGISESVLTPFQISKVNVAPPRKMAGMVWGSMLGYLLLLLMFSGGMYPVIDMTAGEKERRTLEAFLSTPAGRNEIVVGKMLAAMTAIFLTAMLTLTSLVVSIRLNRVSSRSAEVKAMLSTIPLDPQTIAYIALTLAPLCVFAAAVMIAIAMFARSFKEGQSYLTPLVMFVIFPALLGGLPQLTLTPALCLIPIFNASQLIRGILLGDFTMSSFGLTLAANLAYAVVALFIAKSRFEDESVLFRS
jgi:sodium transport system permease protein